MVIEFNENDRLLVIAPHADDEVLGCYGLLNKVKKAGGKTFVQILTLGGYSKPEGSSFNKESWKKEFEGVCKFLKVDENNIMEYNNEEKHLDESIIPQSQIIDYLELKSKISISKIKPTIVAIPTIFSVHQDHLRTYEASIAALRHYHHKHTDLQKFIISYEFLDSSFWSTHLEFGRFTPNFFIPFSLEEINNKVKAFEIYKTQHRSNHRDKDRILTIAKFRGGEMGVKYAEAYQIHRLSLELI